MLYIRFGRGEDTITKVDMVFNNNYDEEWFEDPLVKEMVLDIDKSEVLSPYCIMSPVLGQISPREISGGVKALIMSLKTDWEIWATACGDNCAKWFLEIAKRKDIVISLEHYMVFPEENFPFIDVNTGELRQDYFRKIIEISGNGWKSF